MNKLHAFLCFVALNLMFPKLQAQSEQALSLAGYWRMTNLALSNEDINYLKITPFEDGKFKAAYTLNGELKELIGSIYEIDLINASEMSGKNTYNGQLSADGTINGFYSTKTTNLGSFTWVKVCNDDGLALNGYDLPCVTKEITRGTTTRMVKKLIQVEERTAHSGEVRDENIPLAQTVSEIPEGAILVGHIDLDEMVTYKTVEIEVPEEVPTESSIDVPVKKTKASSSTSSAKKKVIKSDAAAKKSYTIPANQTKSYDAASSADFDIPKFTVCDQGASDPSAKLAAMVRGTTEMDNGHTYHIVGAGETMTAICKIYGITIMELAERNKKECERIFVGEKLMIK